MPPTPAAPLTVIAGGGTVLALASAGLQIAVGGAVAVGVAALTVTGAVGVLTLVRTAGHRWLAASAGWVGSAVMFSWGLYGTLLAATGALPAAGPDPVAGLAQLTGLLGGFALAVAGLLALVRPDPIGCSRVPAPGSRPPIMALPGGTARPRSTRTEIDPDRDRRS